MLTAESVAPVIAHILAPAHKALECMPDVSVPTHLAVCSLQPGAAGYRVDKVVLMPPGFDETSRDRLAPLVNTLVNIADLVVIAFEAWFRAYTTEEWPGEDNVLPVGDDPKRQECIVMCFYTRHQHAVINCAIDRVAHTVIPGELIIHKPGEDELLGGLFGFRRESPLH